MITRYLKAPPFEYIAQIVEVQFVVVLAMAGLIMGLLVHRNRTQKIMDRYKAHFAERLIIEILSLGETAPPTPMVFRPRWFQSRKARALKDVFLEHLQTVSGPEKVYLAQRYEELGYVSHDIALTLSFFWWRRLVGVTNLSLLEQNRFAPLFHRLTFDTNELVAAFSFIPLSGLDHKLNKVIPITKLSGAVLQRKNVVHEILKNWSRIHGHHVLLDQIPLVKDPTFLSLLVKAVATLQSVEVAQVFTEKLKEQESLPLEAIEEMLILLRQVGDPASETVVMTYLTHPEEIIRLRAIEFILNVCGEETLSTLPVWSDSSYVVQRCLQNLSVRGAA